MKKLVSLLLALLMVLSGTALAELTITAPAMPLTEEPVTYTAMIVPHALDTGDANEKAVYIAREEKTGVHIDWEVVPATSSAERKATTFASGDLPDMFVGMLGANDVLTYGMAGALLPISDYLEYMPNFASILENMPAVKSAVTMPDGKIYSIPQINMWSTWPGNGVYARSTIMVNKNWLDALGLAVPTTTDEFIEVMRAFRDNDPNGNGIADEIPLSFIYDGWSENPGAFLFGPFGIVGNGYQLNVEDGKVFYAIQDERYVEAIKFANTMWEEKLIDPEVFTHDQARFYAKGLDETELYGAFVDWSGGSVVGNEKAFGADNKPNTGDETYIAIEPLTGPNGDKVWSNQSAGINGFRMCIASTCENPELLCKWADALFVADEGIEEIWGQFGTHNLKNDDGTWTRISNPTDVNGDEWLLQTTTRGLPALITDEVVANISVQYPDGTVGKKADENKYQLASVYAPYCVKEFYTDPLLTAEANERISVLWTPIYNAMVEKEIAWIMGESDVEAEWASFNENLNAMGLAEIVEIRQAAMDALK